jgi:hypothetical protein
MMSMAEVCTSGQSIQRSNPTSLGPTREGRAMEMRRARSFSHRKRSTFSKEKLGAQTESALIGFFEVLARAKVRLGNRVATPFRSVQHPHHREGFVFGWDIGRPLIP